MGVLVTSLVTTNFATGRHKKDRIASLHHLVKNMSSKKHHKIRRCPLAGCDYHGGDLKRHLSSKKHQDEVDPGLLDAMVQLADKGRKKKGKNKLLLRWCPIKGCSFLTSHLRKHLKQGHHLKEKKKLDRLRKNAEVYRPNHLPSESAKIRVRDGIVETDDDDDDDDEGDDYELPGAKAFFETRRVTTDRHRFLVDFYSFLGTVDEGQKDERVRLQHANQVKKILENIDPGGKDIQALAREDGRAVWNLYVAPRLQDETVGTGTLMSYLGSFSKFLKFVVRLQGRSQSSEGGPSVCENTRKIFLDVIENISGWRSTVAKQRAVLQNERYLKECEHRLAKEDFQAFLKSPVIAKAESLFSPSAKLTGTFQFVQARDYLITRLAVSCGTRPKALETATVENFRQAKRSPEFPGCFVMLVTRHKRQVDGPAIVTMDERLHDFVDVYIRDIRPMIVDSPEENHLFVTKEGKPFATGTIGTRVTYLWGQTGIRPDLRVSCTDFRKCIVTMVEEANKKHRIETGRPLIDNNDVRKLLCHSEKTAKIWYMRENLTSIGARAHTVIERIRDGDLDEERDGIGPGTSSENQAGIEIESGAEVEMESKNATRTRPEKRSTEQNTLPVIAPAPVAIASSLSSPQQPCLPRAPPRERREWSRKDSNLFVEFVKKFPNRAPNQRTIYVEFKASPPLNLILEREGLYRCVLKVRTTFKALKDRDRF